MHTVALIFTSGIGFRPWPIGDFSHTRVHGGSAGHGRWRVRHRGDGHCAGLTPTDPQRWARHRGAAGRCSLGV